MANYSLYNRCVRGTWTHVMGFHLHRYCHKQSWRFNNRKLTDSEQFLILLRGVSGRRLTYEELAAIGDCGFMGIK